MPPTLSSPDETKLFIEGKGKSKWIYIPPLYTQVAQLWITQLYLQITPYLLLPRKRHQMAPPLIVVAHI